MKTDILQWDSDFFGVKTASITLDGSETPEDIDRQLSDLKGDDVRLVYLFSPQSIPQGHTGKWLLADRKRSYMNPSPQANGLSADVKPFQGNPSALHSLAIEAGGHSRFAVDPNIPAKKTEELYTIWIDNSMLHGFADHVFTIQDHDEPNAAMITLRRRGGEISIGLLATHPDHRRRGLARKLIKAAETIAAADGLQLEVTTQADNQEACAFYSSCNFNTFTDTYVYHIWL